MEAMVTVWLQFTSKLTTDRHDWSLKNGDTDMTNDPNLFLNGFVITNLLMVAMLCVC